MLNNTSKASSGKKGKSPATSTTCGLLDLASTLSGPPSTSGAGSINWFEDVDPEGTTELSSTAPNSNSPSLFDDDSVADKYYSPAKDAGCHFGIITSKLM